MRHRKLRLAATAIVVGAIAGLAMGIVAGTRRTDSAPDRYTEHAGGDPDLTITQMFGPPLIDDVTKLPGVISTKSIVFVPSFIVSPIDGAPVFDPNPFAGNDDVLGARVVDGRFTDPTRPNEFTVNRLLAQLIDQRFGLGVGDQFDVVSFSQDQVESNFDTITEPAVPAFSATLVGITESPSDFDEPSLQMVFSASFLDAHPDVGVVQTIMASKLADGADSREVLDAVRRLPNGDGAFAVPTRVVSDSARRAVRFQVTALWLVSAVAMLAAAVVIAQMVGRTVRVSDEERQSMSALGWRRADHAIECAIEGSILVLVAAPVATLVAYAFSPLFPLGVLGTFEPDPGRRGDWLVAVAGVAGLTAVVTLAAVIVGTHRPHEVATQDDVGRLAGVLSKWGASMPLTVGARFARSNSRGRGPWMSLVAGSLGVGALVGSVLVGVTLTTIVDRPERWGVNYDQLFGNPYTSADRDIVAPILDIPDVVAVTGANFGSVTINGSDTATVGFASAKGGLIPTVVDGRDPLTAGEIGLGAEVARRLDVSVGDTVEAVGSSGESHPLTVVGLVVTAPSAGDGAAMTFEGYQALNPEATQNVVLVNFGEDAPASAIDEVAAAMFSPPDSISTPTSVRALERVTAAPFLFAIVMALLLIVGSTYVAATSVRSRRRDLAILRALGSNPRQIRAVVHWQATIVAVTIALFGVPVGLAVGNSIIGLLTDTLGIVPGSNNPGVVVMGAAVLALLVANTLAFLTAQAAARDRIVQLSRDR
ncbi:MAG: FtsX-like permease family protein [Ilumatobacteraceae bacterium]